MRRSLVVEVARPLRRATLPALPQRYFTTSQSLGVDHRRVAGKIEIKTIDDKIAGFPLNHKITAPQVIVKTADGKLSEPQWLDQLLRSIDRSSQYVLQINKPEDDQIPIVQTISRLELIKRINHQEDQQRNQKRTEKEKRPKQLELNWAISANDLQLKMKQMQEFLSKGKKVEILLANKRRQRKASEEEAQALLKIVRGRIDEAGAAETVPMEGVLLRQAVLKVKMRGT